MTTSETPETELKRLEIAAAEIKFADDPGVFSGYASVFNGIDAYGDRIAPGAYAKSLSAWQRRGKLPPMLLQHGGGLFGGAGIDGIPVGKWTSMTEDAKGLKVAGRLFALETERGKYIHEGLKSGVLDGLSIGFKPVKFTMGTKPDQPRRTLQEIDLWEVSIVTMPADDRARISSAKSITTMREFQGLLFAVGFSKSAAAKLAAKGWPGLNGGPEQSEFDDLNDAARRALGALDNIAKGT